MAEEPGTPVPGAATRAPWLWVALAAVYLAAAFLVYRPALDGRFLSDDIPVLVVNPYVQELSLENTRAILDPFGAPVAYTLNWSPLHLLAHAVQVPLFGRDVRGYHAVNVAVHAAVALLLALLLRRSGVGAAGAAVAGAVFLLHPANVEAVAMVFQLKTGLSTALALAALLAHPRRPALAALLFVLALLTKINAVFVWPAACALAWVRAARGEPARAGWLAAWAALAVAVAVPELMAGQRGGEHAVGGEALGVQVRTILSLVARYAAMAFTASGLSAFHQPEPVRAWTDPWWLAGLVLVGALGARTVWGLRRRREEAAFWILAAAGFAPVSQVIPFLYPLADRYLYTILPGLLGGVWLAAADLAPALRARLPAPWRRAAAGLSPGARRAAGAALVAAVLGVLGVRSEARTWVYRTEANLRRDAAAHYPDGLHAHMRRAERAAAAGDVAGVAAGLRAAYERGYVGFLDLVDGEGSLATLRQRPEVAAVIRDMAGFWTGRADALAAPTQIDLYMIGRAQEVRGDPGAARRTLEAALARGGPHDAVLRQHLARLAGSGAGGDAIPEAGPRPPDPLR